jgi:hypothetical protein
MFVCLSGKRPIILVEEEEKNRRLERNKIAKEKKTAFENHVKDQKAALIRTINPLGLVLKDVGGAGNCLFDCLSFAMFGDTK